MFTFLISQERIIKCKNTFIYLHISLGMYRFHQRDKKALPADSPGTRSLSQLTWVKELDKKFKLAEQQMIEKQEAEKQKRRQLGNAYKSGQTVYSD